MGEQAKPCPFCGGEAEVMDNYGENYASCSNNDCPEISWFKVEQWNARPREDALTAENTRLRKVLADVRDNSGFLSLTDLKAWIDEVLKGGA